MINRGFYYFIHFAAISRKFVIVGGADCHMMRGVLVNKGQSAVTALQTPVYACPCHCQRY
jgi:hypothetical protein